MTNTVLIKRSSVANSVPLAGNLQPGELAINYNDGNLFYKNTSNVVTVIASNKFSSVSGNVTGGNIITSGVVSTSGIVGTGNIDFVSSGNISLGNVGNIYISGGSSGYVLSTNGLGNLTWVAQSGGSGGSTITVDDFTGDGSTTEFTLSVTPPGIDNTTVNYNGVIQLRTGYTLSGANIVFVTPPVSGSLIEVTSLSATISGAAGSNTQVQFNDNGDTGASANLTFDKATNVLSVIGNASATYFIGNGSLLTGISAGSTYSNANVAAYLASGSDSSNIITTANVSGGNLITSGLISATGNITGGNILTAGSMSAAGNITAGNLHTNGLVSATGNVYANSFIAGTGTGGNVTGANIVTANIFSAAGNITGGNILTSGLISAAGNITGATLIVGAGTGGNISGANVISANALVVTVDVTGGNLLTGGIVSATGNITGGNILTGGLTSVGGNITGGNILTGGLVSATGNITGGNVNTNNLVGTALTVTSTGNLNLAPTGNINADSHYINAVSDPVQSQDVATKNYVDTMVSSGIAYHQPVTAATTTTLATTTGGTISYTQPNGAGNGIGAYISTTGSFNLIDTANVQTANTRILVKDEANAVLNGVYYWANTTTIVRTSDADEYGPDSTIALSIHDYFFVQSGNVNAGSAYIVSAPTGTITFGTSNIIFSQFSSSQTYTANTSAGMSLTGTVFSAKVDQTTTAFDGSGNIIVKSGAVLTTPNIGAATGTSLNVTGNVDSGNLQTSGVISATSTITSAANITGGNVLTGGLISATGNITGGNILGGANVNATTHTGTTVSVSANVTGGNLLTDGLISATANITGSYIFGNGSQLTGVVATSVGTLSSLSVTGNTQTGNLLTGGLVSATSTITSAANITGGNLLTSGLISATANVTGGNILTSGLVSATGNVTGGNILTGGIISATGNITGSNLALSYGVISTTGLVYDPSTTVLTIGGPSPSNVRIDGFNGILASRPISASGNVTGGNILTGGIISATGNITGNYFIGDGSQLTGITSTATPAGANTQIQFNDGGAFGASANLTFDNSTNTLNATTVTANGVPLATTGKAIAMAIVFGF